MVNYQVEFGEFTFKTRVHNKLASLDRERERKMNTGLNSIKKFYCEFTLLLKHSDWVFKFLPNKNA